MKNMILFFVISALTFCLVSCGEETSEESDFRMQPNGTVLNHATVLRPQRSIKIPMLKKPELPPVNTQTWPMVATGQTKCYDNMKMIDCSAVPPEYAGQDGQKRFGTRVMARRSNNEIVHDNVTNLYWTKRVQTGVSWYEAQTYCDNLSLEGKTWRLPTTAELRAIVNYGKINPAIDPIFYDDANGSVISDSAVALKEQNINWFWASKHVHFDSETNNNSQLSSSWAVYFKDGEVEYTSRYNRNGYAVRCVTKAN